MIISFAAFRNASCETHRVSCVVLTRPRRPCYPYSPTDITNSSVQHVALPPMQAFGTDSQAAKAAEEYRRGQAKCRRHERSPRVERHCSFSAPYHEVKRNGKALQ